jgi:midasin (ATPase involved in ribosome maturation)
MSVESLRLSELRGLSPEQRERRLAAFASGRKQLLNGEMDDLNRQIAVFEKRYEQSSASMRERFKQGAIHETAEICEWLMLLELRDSLGRSSS